MELKKYRTRAQLVVSIEILIYAWVPVVSFLLVFYSCETYKDPTLIIPSNGSNSNLSACRDVRNISGLDWDRNRAQISMGKFLGIVVAHKEYATGYEIVWYFMADTLSSLVLFIVSILFLIMVRRAVLLGMEAGQRNEVVFAGVYLIANSLNFLVFAIWRAADGAWIGFVVGGLLRCIMIAVVAHFYLKVDKSHRHALVEQRRLDQKVDIGSGQTIRIIDKKNQDSCP